LLTENQRHGDPKPIFGSSRWLGWPWNFELLNYPSTQ
jgi:hypothetical protein